MIEVTARGRVEAPAAEVWDLVADFNSLPQWLPGVASSTILSGEARTTGAVRRLDINAAGGHWAVERLESIDHAAHVFTYSIVDSSLAPIDYLSTFRLSDVDGGAACMIEWSARCDAKPGRAEEAETFLNGAYNAGIGKLQRLFS
jgi:uncharacterized protein YndB with AHSA1/START domain